MNINYRVMKLRELMRGRGITAYIIPSSDPHQSEYLADHYKGRIYISGFTGSAGTVVITQEEANLWTDGRYFIQAENQIKDSYYKLFRMGEPGVPNYIDWLKDNIKDGDTIGFDGQVFSETAAKKLEDEFLGHDIKFIDKFDLVGDVWEEDRPALPKDQVFIHEIKYTGLTAKDKLGALRSHMLDKDIDYYLIGSLDDIAWLYNIRGRDVRGNPVVISYALVCKDKAYLFVDKDKIDLEVETYLKENGIFILGYGEIVDYIKDIEDKNIALEKEKINRWLYNAISKTNNIIPEVNYTTVLKGRKNDIEIQNQRNSYIKDGVALTKFLYWLDQNIGRVDIDELSAADRLLNFRKEQDLFIEPSFNTISAYGANAAMAHYSATKDSFSKLEKKGFYLVDSGGQYLDGTTDITRTIAVGELTDEEKRDFTLALKGHINLIDAKFLEGTTGYQVDILCRYPLWREGLDYKHGTGHGVGYLLNVHEGPHRIASVYNDVALEKGMVVSIEPGVYKAGKHGIRIENIVVVDKHIETEFGQFMKFEVLSYVPIDLNAIDIELLTGDEKKWLNDYHNEVYKNLSNYLGEEEKSWLKEKTKKI